tara:strand:- start:76 stop:309 length:234 start_codon:yes stop_codon:yes gene_type:complete
MIPNITINKVYISLADAEHISGLKKRTIKKLIKEGKVVGSRPTYKTLLVKQESLLSYLDDRQVNNKTMRAMLGQDVG